MNAQQARELARDYGRRHVRHPEEYLVRVTALEN